MIELPYNESETLVKNQNGHLYIEARLLYTIILYCNPKGLTLPKYKSWRDSLFKQVSGLIDLPCKFVYVDYAPVYNKFGCIMPQKQKLLYLSPSLFKMYIELMSDISERDKFDILYQLFIFVFQTSKF